MKLYIKYMVSIRCKMIVKSELEKLGIRHLVVDLGEVELIDDISEAQLGFLDAGLKKNGLELMDDKRSILVEKIKIVIIELVHYTEEQIKVNLSDYLSEKLQYDYTYLANLFTEVKGTTIENFYLTNRMERVKELLMYEECTLTEIAHRLHFSSVAHLSNQFKKRTGLTPSQFLILKNRRRGMLENV